MQLHVRKALSTDLSSTQSIYTHHVLHGIGTFEEVPRTLPELTARYSTGRNHDWAWLVASDDDKPDQVVGYGYYAQLKDRSAFRYTAESTIYVRDDARGQGVGKALGKALIEPAEGQGFWQMVAAIGGGDENEGSIALHTALGFERAGVLKAVGWKFGRWLDVVYLQRALAASDKAVPDDKKGQLARVPVESFGREDTDNRTFA